MTDNDHTSKTNPLQTSKGALIKGVLLGIVIAFALGAEICGLILSNIGGSNNTVYSNDELLKQNLTNYKKIQRQATAPTSSPEDMWLYAQLLKSSEIRNALNLTQTNEQIKPTIDTLIKQSADMGYPTALAEYGLSQIFQGAGIDNKPITYNLPSFNNDKITNSTLIDNGLDNLILAYQGECQFSNISSDIDSIQRIASPDTFSKTHFSPFAISDLSNLADLPTLQNTPMIAKINALILRDKTLCCYDPEQLRREMTDSVLDSYGNATYQTLVADYTLAKIIQDNDLMYLQRQKIDSQFQPQFYQDTDKLYQQYMTYFGKATKPMSFNKILLRPDQ